MPEKKTATKVVAKKVEKKTASCGCKAAAKTVLDLSKENIGFKAGDVYQALSSAEKSLTVKEIARKAKISEEETLLGLGWLFKEGKVTTDGTKLTLI